VTGTRSDVDVREEIRAAVRTALREERGLGGEPASPARQPADPRATPAAMTREDVRAEIRAEVVAALRDERAAAGRTTGVAPRTTRERTPGTALPVRKGDPATPETTAAADAERDAEWAARERRLLESVDAQVAERLAAYARADADARARAEADRRASNGEVSREAARRGIGAPARPTQPTQPTQPTAPATPPRARAFRGATLYSGGTFSGGRQALLGGRVDLGALSRSLPGFHLVPEVALGSGSGGTTTLVAANATYQLGGVVLGVLGDVRPHVGLGLGLLNFSRPIGDRRGTDVVLDPAYGFTFEPAFARRTLRAATLGGATPALLVEHQGIGLFDVNRLVLGVTWRR
jgi:hypothetical protein